MRRAFAGIVTAIILAGLLWVGLRRASDPSARETDTIDPAVSSVVDPYAGATARLDDLIASAREGDVEGYLAAFTAPARDRIAGEVAAQGQSAFAEQLRRASRARKSHAVFAPEPEGPDSARITVESVYPEHNERQTYRLERGPNGWLVTEVETVRGRTPAAKYGEPVSYLPPEAPPVPPPGIGERRPGSQTP
jgi:hypothetical protein